MWNLLEVINLLPLFGEQGVEVLMEEDWRLFPTLPTLDATQKSTIYERLGLSQTLNYQVL